jgi:hypothetical protein
MSKSGKPRHIALTAEGTDFFKRERAGKGPGDPIFTKSNGTNGRRLISNVEW